MFPELDYCAKFQRPQRGIKPLEEFLSLLQTPVITIGDSGIIDGELRIRKEDNNS